MKGEKGRIESSEHREGAGEMKSSHFRKKWFICEHIVW